MGIKNWQENIKKKLDFKSRVFLSDPGVLLNAFFFFLLELIECISHTHKHLIVNFHVNIGTSEQQQNGAEV